MNSLFELRELARQTPDVLQRKLLQDAADEVMRAALEFHKHWTRENLGYLVGAWAHAERRFALAKEPPAPPTETGGRMELPKAA